MRHPSFQFYPGDWRGNAKLRRCSEGARGAWIDVLCVLHDADEYGVCRWPLRDLARAAGVSLRSINELVRNNVLKGGDRGAEPYVYVPRHAGKDGIPVTLVEANDGSIWYSSRLVRDEYVRQRRGASTHFTSEKQPPKAKPKVAPKPTLGERQGDGPSSSSSSSKEQKKKAPATPSDLRSGFFNRWKALPDGGGGAFLNRLFRDHKPEQAVLDAIARTLSETRADPKAFVLGCLRQAQADEFDPVIAMTAGERRKLLAGGSTPDFMVGAI